MLHKFSSVLFWIQILNSCPKCSCGVCVAYSILSWWLEPKSGGGHSRYRCYRWSKYVVGACVGGCSVVLSNLGTLPVSASWGLLWCCTCPLRGTGPPIHVSTCLQTSPVSFLFQIDFQLARVKENYRNRFLPVLQVLILPTKLLTRPASLPQMPSQSAQLDVGVSRSGIV